MATKKSDNERRELDVFAGPLICPILLAGNDYEALRKHTEVLKEKAYKYGGKFLHMEETSEGIWVEFLFSDYTNCRKFVAVAKAKK